MKLCYRCYNYATPIKQYSQSAKIWYIGCSGCSSGVFFN